MPVLRPGRQDLELMLAVHAVVLSAVEEHVLLAQQPPAAAGRVLSSLDSVVLLGSSEIEENRLQLSQASDVNLVPSAEGIKWRFEAVLPVVVRGVSRSRKRRQR